MFLLMRQAFLAGALKPRLFAVGNCLTHKAHYPHCVVRQYFASKITNSLRYWELFFNQPKENSFDAACSPLSPEIRQKKTQTCYTAVSTDPRPRAAQSALKCSANISGLQHLSNFIINDGLDVSHTTSWPTWQHHDNGSSHSVCEKKKGKKRSERKAFLVHWNQMAMLGTARQQKWSCKCSWWI